MENYEINEETMAIIPVGYNKTLIKEVNDQYLINEKAYEIMESSCEYYGSSYQGRVDASKKILNSNYKVPVLVEDSESIVFFPTKSSLLEDCCWINHNYIDSYEKDDKTTKITFKNKETINFDISKLSLENQISRSCKLELISRKRKISNKENF